MLTPAEWQDRDYRQPARDLDQWAKSQSGAREDDPTEYVAKLGLNPAGSVIVMNRAHDRVLVPPPARAAAPGRRVWPDVPGHALADQRVEMESNRTSAVLPSRKQFGRTSLGEL